MSAKKQKFQMFLSIVMLAGFAYGIWAVFNFLFDVLSRANPTTVAAVLGSMVAALLSVAGVLITQVYTKRRDIDESHRPQKAEIYKIFLQTIARYFSAQNSEMQAEKIEEKELMRILVEFRTGLILWGSPEVIKAQIAYQRVSSVGGENVLVAVDRLHMAIRADLGLSNKGLNRHELVRLYLKDPDELDVSIQGNNTNRPS